MDISVFSLRENTRTGNGTYGTRRLVWLQFVSVSANKIFPTETILTDTVPNIADQKQEMEHIEQDIWLGSSL